jgi:hypothetical protein
VRRYAIIIAVAGFFVLAAVGHFCGVPPFVCGLRALGGAAVLYLMTMIAGKAVLGILVDTILRARDIGKSASERRSE